MRKRLFHPASFLFFLLLIFLSPPSRAQTAAGVFSLDETLKSLGAKLRWDPFFTSGVLEFGEHFAVFQAEKAGEGSGGNSPVLLDNRDVISLPAPFLDNGRLFFPEQFVTSLKTTLAAIVEEDKERFHIAAIIVDPGHGGKDPGTRYTHRINGKQVLLQEKDIVLRVARDLHSRLTQAFPGKRVLLTREGDTFPTLEDRVALANSVPLKENEAIVFVSVHANGSLNREAHGYELWILPPEYRRTVVDPSKSGDSRDIIAIRNAMLEEEYTTESILIAQSIMKHMDLDLGAELTSRGIKEQDWYVVRNARMPAVLVELGFVSNLEDALFMLDADHLKKFSEAIYKGIMNYVNGFERAEEVVQER